MCEQCDSMLRDILPTVHRPRPTPLWPPFIDDPMDDVLDAFQHVADTAVRAMRLSRGSPSVVMLDRLEQSLAQATNEVQRARNRICGAGDGGTRTG
jgi:hypothetical protein